MIRTLAWKEYREQRAVWVALAVLAAVLLVSALAAYLPARRAVGVIVDVLTGEAKPFLDLAFAAAVFNIAL